MKRLQDVGSDEAEEGFSVEQTSLQILVQTFRLKRLYFQLKRRLAQFLHRFSQELSVLTAQTPGYKKFPLFHAKTCKRPRRNRSSVLQHEQCRLPNSIVLGTSRIHSQLIENGDMRFIPPLSIVTTRYLLFIYPMFLGPCERRYSQPPRHIFIDSSKRALAQCSRGLASQYQDLCASEATPFHFQTTTSIPPASPVALERTTSLPTTGTNFSSRLSRLPIFLKGRCSPTLIL